MQLFESIHHDMMQLSRFDPNCSEMGQTLTLAWFRRDRVYFGHIGDSRLYHVHADGAMQQVSEDHTMLAGVSFGTDQRTSSQGASPAFGAQPMPWFRASIPSPATWNATLLSW